MKNPSDATRLHGGLPGAAGRRLRAAAAATWLLAACAFPLSAAENVIREITVENLGPGAVDRGFVDAHTAMDVGSPFDGNAVARDVRSLLDTRRFESVEIHAEEIAGGVRLIYSVRNKLRLAGRPQIEVGEHFSEKKIRNWINLEAGDFVDEQTLAAQKRKVIDEYRKDYYPDADVTWKVAETNAAEGLAELKIRIHEGERSRIRKFRFSGNRGVSSRDLGKVVRQRAWWNPLAWFGGTKLDETELRMARMDLHEHYVEAGYLDAVVQEPAKRQYKKGKLQVTFAVEEGDAYRFGKIGLHGFELYSEASLREKITCREGEPAKAEAIRTTLRNLEDFYGSQGYVGTRVRQVLSPRRPDGVVDIDFTVMEGKLTTIRNIRIRGNTRTRDKVIRRELSVYPAELYNTVKVEQSKRVLMNLGFFSDVRTYDAPTVVPDERDLIVEVEEKRTGQLMLGAGFSSEDDVIGYVELGQGNFDLTGWPYFTGGGQKLRVRAQFGTRRKLYEISFTEPWFLDRRLSLGFDLFHSDSDYNDYDVKRTGGAVNLGLALPGRNNRILFRYQLERVDLYNFTDTNRYVFADDPSREYYFAQESDTTESSLRTTLSHDSRNHSFFPTRGNRAELFGQISGGPMGFDTDVYRVGFRSWHYLPLLFGHVLSFRTRYEVVDEYGNTEEMPITSRLYLGGGRTLRGFDYREVGPKVIREVPTAGGTSISARPYGGRSLALAGAEYTLPVISHVRLAAFYDTGNAWLDAYDIDFDDLASSYGVGVRLDIPGFPIRVDRAWVIDYDDEYTGKDEWVLWIGYDF